ncbi:MAG TPA: tetratricopeptide repeat protein [Rudaea sp.]|nr:tetratricopeptide repeat protein [Rudaea sp.]
MNARTSIFSELRRRNVLRAGVLYIGAVWALAQGVSQLTPAIGLPEYATRWLLVACVVGFPFWIAFAWFYEFTPQGLKRESEIAPGDVAAHSNARKLDFAIIAVLVIAVVLLVTNQFVWRRGATDTTNATDTRTIAAALAKVPAKSVAVLPFLNESGDKDQQYFSDGLSEEMISALGQVHDLKVIGRDSSFRFHGKTQDDSAGIAAKLGVATLLEGSVRMQGDKIRIVASLIKASDGSVLWSQTYDRRLKDVFAMQGEIATSVANALKATLLNEPAVTGERPPGGNMAAYDALLQGRYYAEHRNRTDYFKAVRYYQQAIALDPDYALAYARLAIAQQWFIDWEASYEERMTTSPLARANAQKAVALAPQSAIALGALGLVQAWTDFDYPAAEATLKKAVALDPSNAETLYQLADVTGCLGRLDEAVAMMRKALVLEPLNASFRYYTGEFLLALGKLDQAEAELRRAMALQPGADAYGSTLALVLMKRSQFQQALAAAKSEPNGQSRRQALPMIYFAMGDKARAQTQLNEEIRQDGGDTPGLIAEVYAYEGNADQALAWLDRGLQVRDSSIASIYEAPDVARVLATDPRFAAFCTKAGLPTPAEVKARIASDAGHG